MTLAFFAATPKAMEHLLAEELHSLGAQQIKETVAGVHFSGDLSTGYRACLWSRIANRVLLPLAHFPVTSQEDLYRGVQTINWHDHLKPDGSFAVTFNAKNSTVINNSHFGALKVKDAVVDQLRENYGSRPHIDTERPDIRINVLLNRSEATLSLDLSGESLHRRGYRDASIKAPIKENLAAALLMRCNWPKIARQGGTLIDPMCGSGTFLIEGAMMAADYAPGLLRDYFGFLGWKQHQPTLWKTLIAEANTRKSAGLVTLPVIAGFDHNRRNLSAAQIHVNNAGLTKWIQLDCQDISTAAPQQNWQPGLLICNPPYGERLGDTQSTALLYKQFGETLKRRFNGWQAGLIIGDQELGFRIGIRSQKPVVFYNGALECVLLRMTIDDKAFFEPKPLTAEDRLERINSLINDPYRSAKARINAIDEDKPIKHQQTTPLMAEETYKTPATGTTDAPEKPKEETSNNLTATDFANRLKKNLKNLAAWANKNKINCYRIYDADLPEYAAAIDLYRDINDTVWLNVQEYEPPKTVDPAKANQRLAALLTELPKALMIQPSQISLKIRRKQKQTDQYEKLDDQGRFHIVDEHGCRLQVNFTDYLDTGLFLDHRPLRLMIQQQAKGKRFLNLFAYTGSATVHAAIGGAKTTTTVDLSNTYLDWAKTNLALNKNDGNHEFIQADCLQWLEDEAKHPYPRQYDLILLDPPTFSNSKRMDDIFDIQQDHVRLINQALKLLHRSGVLYFSTNFRRFKLDQDALSSAKIEDISAQTIPADFARNPKIHYCWRITK
ncbi:MAG: bifunctional 23S rRNA (guanine(2069)-N(7))-methyltransferase RlmK/23S rRNA (guanine(2445)-N(2))-methyltransferase RlmL [Gammaproteobacteria bacterium]|nr:bifunctional 23S rRNA (guanine(2069)-N(7))-methyltransferase RlmK/23S rRNA (guanine(2445)-N(2))-methyltransferase RlmL [Gammaproteobacteria bacterium]